MKDSKSILTSIAVAKEKHTHTHTRVSMQDEKMVEVLILSNVPSPRAIHVFIHNKLF